MVEYVDKRKLNTDGEAIANVADLPSCAPAEIVLEEGNNSWKEVCYVTGMLRQPSGMVMIGKAIGLRGDDRVFDTEYPLPQVWEEDEHWQKIAKQRLDSFLGCSCNGASGVCNMHKMLLEEWRKSDSNRITRDLQRGMPTPMRAYLEAQAQAAASQQTGKVLTMDPRQAN